MATYAIGDIQGCYKTLKALLRLVSFNEKNDRLFLVGDLVNRGPQSLEVLRLLMGLGERVISVLGNHDLHLIAYASGILPDDRKTRPTLDHVLRARNSSAIIEWLRNRPILHREQNYIMTHAGILPIWTVNAAEKWARKLESALSTNAYIELLTAWYNNGNMPEVAALNAFTKIRTCFDSSTMDLSFDGPPEMRQKGTEPWFELLRPEARKHIFIFGHWSALGLRIKHHVMALDSGCVWGRYLSAVRLEDGAIFFQNTREL